jgi:8-oxo-dGTP diphosphatase
MGIISGMLIAAGVGFFGKKKLSADNKKIIETERFKMTVYVIIIVRKENKILLMKRSQSVINGGLYAFPGGGVDGSETLMHAIIRESKEELGIILAEESVHFVHTMHVKTEKNGEFIAFYFETSTYDGNPSIMEPDKCDELAWFDRHALPQPMINTHEHALNMIDQKIVFSEFGW